MSQVKSRQLERIHQFQVKDVLLAARDSIE